MIIDRSLSFQHCVVDHNLGFSKDSTLTTRQFASKLRLAFAELHFQPISVFKTA